MIKESVKGRKKVNMMENQVQKGKGKGKARPGARAVDWDGDQEYPDQ